MRAQCDWCAEDVDGNADLTWVFYAAENRMMDVCTACMDKARAEGRYEPGPDGHEFSSYPKWQKQCTECEEWMADDEVVWATREGVLSTDVGLPWCVSCCPNQPEGDPE